MLLLYVFLAIFVFLLPTSAHFTMKIRRRKLMSQNIFMYNSILSCYCKDSSARWKMSLSAGKEETDYVDNGDKKDDYNRYDGGVENEDDVLETMIKRAADELSQQRTLTLEAERMRRQVAKKAKADREYEAYWERMSTSSSSSSSSSPSSSSTASKNKKIDPGLRSFSKAQAVQREYYSKKSFSGRSVDNIPNVDFDRGDMMKDLEEGTTTRAESKGAVLLLCLLATLGFSTLSSLSL